MPNKEMLVRYLLGGLSQEERERVEEQYFTGDQGSADLETVETDLIDSYVRNQLSAVERDQFEKYFLASPRRRQRLEFAKVRMVASSPSDDLSLVAPAAPLSTPRSFALRIALAAALGVLIIAVVILGMQNLRLHNQLGALESHQATLQQKLAELQQQIANETDHRTTPETSSAALLSPDQPTISLLLTPGSLRGPGSAAPTLPVSPVASTVLLLVQLRDATFASYEVALTTAEGKLVRRLEGLNSTQMQSTGAVVPAKFPSNLLRRGDYIITLSGKTKDGKSEVIDSFTFTVLR